MKIPIKYSLRNFKERKLTTGITILGIAMVVFVFAAVLMMAYGIEKTLVQTGSDDNVIILRKSSSGEISSILPPDVQNIVASLPNIAKTSGNIPIISYEPVVIINLDKVGGGLSNIIVRGVSPESKILRPNIKLIEGRFFNYGARELIVGKSLVGTFKNSQIGEQIKFAGGFWKIVGIFEASGGGFESEFWGDSKQVLDAFNRGNTVSTMTLKLNTADEFPKFKKEFLKDRRLKEYEPKIEKVYFAEQSETMAMFIRILGIVVTVIFSIGATIGAMITMYSAVANRTVEIGTLRSLGFKRRNILAAFLMESLLVSLIGAGFGILFASILQFFSISTLNYASFAELSFKFAMSPSIIISSLIFASLMGILGGFLPAVRAARLNIIKALRSI